MSTSFIPVTFSTSPSFNLSVPNAAVRYRINEKKDKFVYSCFSEWIWLEHASFGWRVQTLLRKIERDFALQTIKVLLDHPVSNRRAQAHNSRLRITSQFLKHFILFWTGADDADDDARHDVQYPAKKWCEIPHFIIIWFGDCRQFFCIRTVSTKLRVMSRELL